MTRQRVFQSCFGQTHDHPVLAPLFFRCHSMSACRCGELGRQRREEARTMDVEEGLPLQSARACQLVVVARSMNHDRVWAGTM